MKSKLVDVSTTEVVATRSFDDEAPEWLVESEVGTATMKVRSWADDQIVISITLAMRGEDHAVKVTISGLYEADANFFTLDEAEQNSFAHDEVRQLVPFLRQAVYNASSLVWPVMPILLDTDPEAMRINPGELVEAEERDQSLLP